RFHLAEIWRQQAEGGEHLADHLAGESPLVGPAPVDGVIPQQVGKVVRRDQVVDRDHLRPAEALEDLNRRPADPPQAVDRDVRHDTSPRQSCYAPPLPGDHGHTGSLRIPCGEGGSAGTDTSAGRWRSSTASIPTCGTPGGGPRSGRPTPMPLVWSYLNGHE